MRAAVRREYGAPERVLRIEDVPRPDVAGDGVLVRVRAVSVNRLDWYTVTGTPYLVRLGGGVRAPKDAGGLGADFAGVVEAVGRDVTAFRPGDEVYGLKHGAFAEYVHVPADGALAPPPSACTAEEAAALPTAGLTALQGLRDHGRVRPGQHVLVHGASGGVGTFAVQVAKALGAEVTAVCSTRNVEQARALGADHVVDYTREDFTRGRARYDVLFDNAGTRPWRQCARVLAPRATVVLVGGPANRVLGPVGHVAAMKASAATSRRRAVFFVAKPDPADLAALAELVEAGRVRPVVERRYAFAELAAAVTYLGAGHARGKVVVPLD